MESSRSAIRLEAVRKVYGTGNNSVVALAGVSIDFRRGSFTAVMGPSGSGKSTLLHCAAGLDLAADIPGARLIAMEGAGHEPPPRPRWDVVVSAILAHTADNPR